MLLFRFVSQLVLHQWPSAKVSASEPEVPGTKPDFAEDPQWKVIAGGGVVNDHPGWESPIHVAPPKTPILKELEEKSRLGFKELRQKESEGKRTIQQHEEDTPPPQKKERAHLKPPAQQSTGPERPEGN
ncbi:hypothetical protein AVEN_30134-1 [Araneus ventricosus]|uniref:Uncharacterized protein n=1 Tax=Araneus ventricosus TaxID=182803 RepID=A0A4Y2WDM9_ARAVE|nr:hypothetical protein AVEN_30134-1 [Araneus ventricosus]